MATFSWFNSPEFSRLQLFHCKSKLLIVLALHISFPHYLSIKYKSLAYEYLEQYEKFWGKSWTTLNILLTPINDYDIRVFVPVHKLVKNILQVLKIISQASNTINVFNPTNRYRWNFFIRFWTIVRKLCCFLFETSLLSRQLTILVSTSLVSTEKNLVLLMENLF